MKSNTETHIQTITTPANTRNLVPLGEALKACPGLSRQKAIRWFHAGKIYGEQRGDSQKPRIFVDPDELQEVWRQEMNGQSHKAPQNAGKMAERPESDSSALTPQRDSSTEPIPAGPQKRAENASSESSNSMPAATASRRAPEGRKPAPSERTEKGGFRHVKLVARSWSAFRLTRLACWAANRASEMLEKSKQTDSQKASRSNANHTPNNDHEQPRHTPRRHLQGRRRGHHQGHLR